MKCQISKRTSYTKQTLSNEMPTQQFWHSGPKDNFQLDEQFTATSQLFLTDLTFQTQSVRGQIRKVELLSMNQLMMMIMPK